MEGRSLRHYRILEKLGAGGMGEVYRGKDTRLGRDVAIKVLPEALAGNPDRLARFEREAQLLGALNDSHVGAIYGLERVEGLSFLVLELVEGETLADRIGRGALPLDEALELGGQIAHGLEVAHAQGVIHRDLKPANVMVTPEGQVKLLDFGLARALAPHDSDAAGTHTPTITEPLTQAGAVFGTAAYMSPEQVRGEEAGRPADVWALGCVLYEMLAGKRAFARDTVADTMSAVLEHEPEWERLPKGTPESVRRLLRRCLAKDSGRRQRDVADVGLELEESGKRSPEDRGQETGDGKAGVRVRPLAWAVSAVVVTVVAALLSWISLRPEPRSSSGARFELPPPDGTAVSFSGAAATLAISPNGQHVAFIGYSPGSSAARLLYVRSIDELEAWPVKGSSRANTPFFSPDGRWLGFHADSLLKRVAISGGEPVPITEARSVRGATWGEDGSIVFAAGGPEGGEGIFRVSAEGGEVEVVVPPDPALGSHLRWPQHLPGGKTVLVSHQQSQLESERGIGVLSLETGRYQEIRKGGSYPQYHSSGHLIYSRLRTLYAVGFDLERLAETEGPRPMTDNVYNNLTSGFAGFAVSQSGVLVYQHDRAPILPEHELVWVDRQGSATTATHDRRPYQSYSVALSPDERSIAVSVWSSPEEADLWIIDRDSERSDSLTRAGGLDEAPRWSPDGKWIVFHSTRSGGQTIWRTAADGSGIPEQLTFGPWDEPGSFSPDGQVLLFQRAPASAQWDILSIRPDEDEPAPNPFLTTEVLEWQPRFSPNGRWVAYVSRESGRGQIYVRPYPGPSARVPITKEGGSYPAWNPDGRELFYWSADSLWAVPVETEPEFSVGEARALFEARPRGVFGRFDVSGDGQRFLMVRDPGGEAIPLRLVYVPDFVAELEQNAAPEN